MRLLHTRLAAILLLGLCPLMAQAGLVLDRIKSNGSIQIGYREAAVPLSYANVQNKPVGYALDLCVKLTEAIRKKLTLTSLRVVYFPVTPGNRIALVESGKVDLECGATTNNAERRKSVAFTVPHYISGVRYAVRANSPFTELRELKAQKLAAAKGTTPYKAVDKANREYSYGVNLIEVADHAAAVNAVVQGTADAAAVDDILLYGLIAGLDNPSQIKVVGKFLTIEPLAIMLSKEDTEFKKIVDDEMKRLINSREAFAIYDKWFLAPIPPKNKALALPMNYLLKDFWKYPTDRVPE